MIIGIQIEFRLEGFGELGAGRAEIRLVDGLGLPLRGHGDAERGGTEGRELLVAGRHQEAHPCEIGLLVVELARERGAIGIMAAAEQRIGLRADDLVDDGAVVGGVRRIGFVEHDLEPRLARLLAGGAHHRLGERIVRVDEGHGGLRVLGVERVDRAAQIVIGRGDDLKQVLVAELVGLALGAAGDHHDLAVLLADHGGGSGEARGIGAEQELRLVLDDEARIELLHPAALGLVVVGDVAHLVALVARLDASGRIDLVAPHLGAAHLGHRIHVERAGLRQGHADGDFVFGRDRGRGSEHAQRNSRGSELSSEHGRLPFAANVRFSGIQPALGLAPMFAAPARSVKPDQPQALSRFETVPIKGYWVILIFIPIRLVQVIKSKAG